MDSNTELVFRVTQESDGGYCAECLTEGIFTQGDTWEELEFMIREPWTATSSTTGDPEPFALNYKNSIRFPFHEKSATLLASWPRCSTWSRSARAG